MPTVCIFFCSIANNQSWLLALLNFHLITTDQSNTIIRMRHQFVDPSPVPSSNHTWTRFTVTRNEAHRYPQSRENILPVYSWYTWPYIQRIWLWTVPVHTWGHNPKMLTGPHNPQRTKWDCEVAKYDTLLTMTFELIIFLIFFFHVQIWKLVYIPSRNLAQKMKMGAPPWSQAWEGSSLMKAWWSCLGPWSLAGPNLKEWQDATSTWTHHLQGGPSRPIATDAGWQVRKGPWPCWFLFA